jgi:hypothetical protein
VPGKRQRAVPVFNPIPPILIPDKRRFVSASRGAREEAESCTCLQSDPPLSHLISAAFLWSGTSSGIGQEVAKLLASAGYIVYGGVRNEKDGQLVEQLSPNIKAIILDVTVISTIDHAVKLVTEDLQARGLPFVGLVSERDKGWLASLLPEDMSRS